MGCGDRQLGANGSALGDALCELAPKRREAVRLRLDTIGVLGHEPRADDRGRTGFYSRDSELGPVTADAVWPSEGACRKRSAEILPGAHHDRATWPHHRTWGSHRSIHVLAGADRARWRGARPGRWQRS